MLRVVVVLLAASFVLWRVRPQWRLPWAVPLVVVGVVLAARTLTWLTGD